MEKSFSIVETIYSWRDLEAYGIDMLTGEACGLAMRLLCDVTEKGKTLIERFLGGTVTIREDSNWNGGSPKDPHVGSVLLPRNILTDLAAFCLLTQYTLGNIGVYTLKEGGAVAYEGTIPEYYQERIERCYRRSTDPGTGDRNQHMMSGRTE